MRLQQPLHDLIKGNTEPSMPWQAKMRCAVCNFINR